MISVKGLFGTPPDQPADLLLVCCVEGYMRETYRRKLSDDIQSKFSRTSLAASTFAGLSVLGLSAESRDTTLRS